MWLIFSKLRKKKSYDTILGAMVIILSNLRSSKHEKERGTKIVSRTPSSGISSPHFTTDSIYDTLHEKSKQLRILGSGVHENCQNVFLKNMRQLLILPWSPRVGGGG